ncbi:MAG: hypothetical protein HZC51_06670 [Nitrospirae bacterium]|nr:hypothetical protein [Nitrospirota bacterium]
MGVSKSALKILTAIAIVLLTGWLFIHLAFQFYLSFRTGAISFQNVNVQLFKAAIYAVILLSYLVPGYFGYKMAKSQGRNEKVWAVICSITTFFGLGYLYFSRQKKI